MAKVNGFEIAYSHRGSWTADISESGEFIERIPVTWDKDYKKSEDNRLLLNVWFKTASEAQEALGRDFLDVAVAKWKDGSASSNDIMNILRVKPQRLFPDPDQPEGKDYTALECEVLERRTRS